MRELSYRMILFNSFFVILLVLSACTGEQDGTNGSTSSNGDLPAGSDLISKMKEAIDDVDTANLKATFQFGTVDGAIKGSLEFWAQRPKQTRFEVNSEDESLNGMIVVSNEDKSWAFSPNENLVLVSESNQFKAQLNEQPELRDIIEFGEKLSERGVDTTEAQTLGSETINGRETYKVKATYDGADLEGVTVTYYIDKEQSLPQRVEIKMERDEVSISGFMELNGDMSTDSTIDSAQFTFNPPTGAILFDLSELPPLPDFSNSDIFKNE